MRGLLYRGTESVFLNFDNIGKGSYGLLWESCNEFLEGRDSFTR